MKASLYFLILTILLSCSSLQKNRSIARDESAYCDQYLSRIVNENHTDNFVELKRTFSNFSEIEKEQVLANMDAIYYIDFDDQLSQIHKFLVDDRSVADVDLSTLYNLNSSSNRVKKFFNKIFGWKEKSTLFGNFQEVKHYLNSVDASPKIEVLLKSHELMMKGQDGAGPGQLRDIPVIGNVPKSRSISEIVVKEINKNPYLYFKEQSKDGDKSIGFIQYPDAESIQAKTLNLLSAKHQDLVKSIQAFQANKIGDKKILTRKLVNALVEDLLEWFVLKRNQIGPLEASEDIKGFITLVAKFQRNLVSIHPFRDGNGRTIREFALNNQLLKVGLPPSRLLNPSNDLYFSEAKWIEEIQFGMINSREIILDFKKRQDLGLKLSNSSEWILPKLVRELKIDLKKQGSIKISEDYKNILIDKKQFIPFYREYLKGKPGWINNAQVDINTAYKDLIESFIDFQKKHNLIYDHKKFGIEHVRLNFADKDFLDWFGRHSFLDLKKFQAKRDLWYYDRTIWRGLSYQSKSFGDDDIVSIFKSLSPGLLTSNNTAGLSKKSQTRILQEIKKDFKRYNQELYNGDFVQMARDHSEVGPQYRTSYGYSTSKNRTVAKAYAMGAMVIADYGKHHDIELQRKLSARVLVGMKQSKKDIDLTRLKQLYPEFSYQYGRQQEIMGVGGADPDSVEIVQLIDENGDVEMNYFRDPREPSQILVFKGEFNPSKDDWTNYEVLQELSI